jgi:hypothetical protein
MYEPSMWGQLSFAAAVFVIWLGLELWEIRKK